MIEVDRIIFEDIINNWQKETDEGFEDYFWYVYNVNVSTRFIGYPYDYTNVMDILHTAKYLLFKKVH